MFDVVVKQSMNVDDFCETYWKEIFDRIDADIYEYLLANFGIDSQILNVFCHTASNTYMSEILEEFLKIAKKRKEESC